MRILKFFGSLFCVFALGLTYGQTSKSIQRKIHTLETKGDFVEAAKLHVSLHDEGEQEASINAAMMLYKSGKLKDALFYFQHADSIGSLDNPDEVFAFFQCLKSEKKYKDADELIATHLPKNQNAVELAMNSDKSKFYEKLMGYGKTRIKSIPVNTEFSEFGPAVLDGWLYFESSRITKSNDDLHGINNQAYFNLYAHAIGDSTNSVVEPQGSFGKPQVTISSGGKQTLSIPADINKSQHDGPVYITPDGKHLFYTTNWHHEGKRTFKNTELNLGYSSTALEKADRKDVGKIHLNIYYSTREGSTWSTPVPFPYNSNNYSNQHGYFDEKTGTLYYSSNMPGGVGGFDIWRSVLKGDSWSQPENLGPMVNTIKQEVFPVLSPDGLLIFSSNGWPGLGGLDLFVSENNDEEPINMLAGMNTEKDDFGMVFVKKGVGYFVSNRNESVGDDDIYEFQIDLEEIIDYLKPKKRFINLIVKDDKTQTIIKDVSVTITGNKPFNDQSNQLHRDTLSFREIDPGEGKVTIKIERPGYEPKSISIDDWKDGLYAVDLPITMLPIPEVVVERPMFEVTMLQDRKFVIYVDPVRFNTREEAAGMLLQASMDLFVKHRASELLVAAQPVKHDFQKDSELISKVKFDAVRQSLIDRGINPVQIKASYHPEIGTTAFCDHNNIIARDVHTCLTPFGNQSGGSGNNRIIKSSLLDLN